jgi:hypothetical protein
MNIVRRNKHRRSLADSHGRFVREVDEAESLDILSKDIASIAGLRSCPHVRRDPDLLANDRLVKTRISDLHKVI